MGAHLTFVRIDCTRSGCHWHIQTYVSASLLDEWTERVTAEHRETCQGDPDEEDR